MQETETHPAITALLEQHRQRMVLVIGNKNYSSWSMRAWLVMSAFGIPFDEVRIALGQADTAARIASYSAAGKVPVLIANNMVIWDSLAICEFLAEQFSSRQLWPADTAARAHARSICAEMHASFASIRHDMPMNIRADLREQARSFGAQADIGRICEIWEDCLTRYGAHAYLFGEFCIADAYFAPIIMRLRSYGIALAPALQAYAERLIAHPAVAAWIAAALAETDTVAWHEARSGS